MDLTPLTHTAAIEIDATPDQVYATVSDVTRTGEWSPICVGCEWDEGRGPEVGAWFVGYNELPERKWETRSEVVVAEPGQEFAWKVNGNLVRWAYRTEPIGDGTRTRLHEDWEFTVDGLAFFHDKYGDTAQAEIDERARLARDGIPVTLAAIKQVIESGANASQ